MGGETAGRELRLHVIRRKLEDRLTRTRNTTDEINNFADSVAGPRVQPTAVPGSLGNQRIHKEPVNVMDQIDLLLDHIDTAQDELLYAYRRIQDVL